MIISPWLYLHRARDWRYPSSRLWTELYLWNSPYGSQSSHLLHLSTHHAHQTHVLYNNADVKRSGACAIAPGLCLMLDLEPHFEVILLTSTFLLRIWICEHIRHPKTSHNIIQSFLLSFLKYHVHAMQSENERSKNKKTTSMIRMQCSGFEVWHSVQNEITNKRRALQTSAVTIGFGVKCLEK